MESVRQRLYDVSGIRYTWQADHLLPEATLNERQRSRRAWACAVTLLAIAGWLAIGWPHHSLWYDETLTTWVASGPWDRLIHWCTQVDIQVPLHYVVLHGWMALFGSSEFALHLLPALCALLAIAGLIALARRLAGPTAAVIAGLLLGLSPGFLWIAYEVRAYALALALFAWASVLLHELLKSATSPRRWLIAAYSALVLAMLYTHYTGIGALAAHAAIVGWTALSRRSWTVVRRMALAALITGVGFAPWLPVLFSRGSADRSFYAGAILPDQTLGVILSFKWLARDDFKWLTPDQAISPLAPLVAGGLIVLVGGVAIWLVIRRRWLPVIYGLCMALLPGAMIAIVVYFKPKLAGRYAWPSWIGLDLLLALGSVALGRWMSHINLALNPSPQAERDSDPVPDSPCLPVERGVGGEVNWRAARITFIVALALVAVPWLTGQTGHPPDSDFRGVFAAIREQWRPGDLVILRDGTLFPAAEYYRSPPYLPLPEAYLTDTTHVLHAAEAVPILAAQPDSIRGVWVVSWQGDVMDPENVTSGLLEAIGVRQPVAGTFGDVGLDYYALTRPLSSLQAPATIVTDRPDGLALDSIKLATPGPLHPGDRLVAHSWWQRGPASSSARVSIRLYGPDDRVYGQIDQPPAGWTYLPDRWPDNTPILGRYEMSIPPDAPGEITLKLVIYSLASGVAPITVPVGTVTVQAR
jgi:hypothetical protein